MEQKEYDILIIGAGTAGLTAAIYGVRAGKSVLLIEKAMYGGQIVNARSVENYPGIPRISGYEFASSLYEQATGLGAEMVYDTVTGIQKKDGSFLAQGSQNQYRGRAVILATGAKARPLGLENEERFTGAGISYCAACDGAFFRGKDVAVVGGGNTALADALVLSDLCRSVAVIHRRDAFRGEDRLVRQLQEKTNIHYYMGYQVIRLTGETQLTAVTLRAAGGEELELPVSGLFIAVGQEPENEPFRHTVALDGYGYVCADEGCQTQTDGIFAAGDCRTKKLRQLTTAAADGAAAAVAACEYLG